ncbi:outer membrane protein, nutrient binding [Filimonas lacunae]|nr:outer membrane protein, nutrient binding [Filimonas lacunae]
MLLFLQLTTKVHSQKISLNLKQASLSRVLDEISKQAGVSVIYNENLIVGLPAVTISVKDASVQEVLDKCLKDLPLAYDINGLVIRLKSKKSSAAKGEVPATGNPDGLADIKGKVICGDKPLAGASITLAPGGRGVSADENGNFTLPEVAPGNYKLSISSLGCQGTSRDLLVSGSDVFLNISLKPAAEEVAEVVVTVGYTQKKPGEITGAIQTISGEQFRKGIMTSDPVSMLKGLATGLYISEQNAGDPTSSGGQIFVRGQSSIAGVGVDQVNEYVMPKLNYGPLIVLDGVILPNQNLKDVVSPQEIDNISVLKDAAATAIYGSRAAAGVLVVTTKKGAGVKSRITAEIKYGLNHPNRGPVRYLNGRELYNLQKEYYTQDYQINEAALSAQYPTAEAYLNYRLPSQADLANEFNWQDYAFVNSSNRQVDLSASGGNDRTKYYVGGTYYDEQSTGVNNRLKRGSLRLNLTSNVTDRLQLNVSINGIMNDGNRDVGLNAAPLLYLFPWANPYNADGSLKPYLLYKVNGATQQRANPLFENQYNFNRLRSQLLFGSIRLQYKITDWLTFSTTNSGNLNYSKNETYYDVRSFTGSGQFWSSQGFLGTNTSYLYSFLTSNQLNMRKSFGEHSITALAAMEYGKTTAEDMLVNVNHVPAGYPVITLAGQLGGSFDLSSYGIPSTKAGNLDGGKEQQAVYSVFGEAAYTFKRRYSVSASVRTDASSNFGRDQRYGTFFSTGGAWVLSEEQFLKSCKAINNLKLRANYGTSGSQLGDNFLTQTLYQPGSIYGGQAASTIAILGNPSLRWEVTRTVSTGLDVGLWNRFNASVDFYNRDSRDLLQKVTLPAVAGFRTQWRNVAAVRNRGIELLINSTNVRNKNFQWTSSFNISYNTNSIIKVADDSLKQGYSTGTYYLYKGEDINAMKAIRYSGVDAQTGKPLFEKLLFDEKGNIAGKQYVNTVAEVGGQSDPRQFQTLGSFRPRYFGGLTNTFTYKQFSLNVLITYAFKYIVNDYNSSFQQGSYIPSVTQLAFRSNQKVWTQPGQADATEPMLYYHSNTSYYASSKSMHDGSHARLRSIRLGYELSSFMTNKLRISGMTLYVSADNLWTVYSKNLLAADPEGPSVGEAQSFGNSVGAGLGAPRRYVFGVQVIF